MKGVTMGMQDEIDTLNRELKKAVKNNSTLQADMEALVAENTSLSDENSVLKQSVADALAKCEELQKQLDELPQGKGDRLVSAAVVVGKKYIRGKLAGEKYIKTDKDTGKFEEISKAEFDSLPSK